MTETAHPSLAEKNKKAGRIVFACFLAFFGLIVVVNYVFVTQAIKTHTGVIKDRAYERGLNYNETLAQAKEQEALGYRDYAAYENGQLIWRISSSKEIPMRGLESRATLIRPVQAGHDFTVPLKEIENGVYAAKLDAPMKGLWLVQFETSIYDTPYKNAIEIMVQ